MLLLNGGRRARLFWVLGVLIAGTSLILAAKPPKPGKSQKPKTKVAATPEDLFASNAVFQIAIEIPEAGIAVLRDSPRGWGGPQGKRPTVNATVREGDKVYTDVAIHLKGAAGSFRPIDDEPALTLNFDKNVKGQTFHGIQRISLNNSVQDPSLLNEQICREMFASQGIPVPRATHAQVKLNGRDLGVYVLTEAFNKQFLARHFKSANGNLYDGGFLKDITDDLEKSSGPNPEDRSDLKRLAEAAEDPNPTNRLARLEKLLDLNQFITYLALDVMMCDWDGYGVNKNNYRIYHDPDSDKIVFMPHGLDQMFGVMRVGTDMPIFPRMNGLVARAVMQTPECRQRYRQRMTELMASVYDVPKLTNRVWELANVIRPYLSERGAGRSHSFDRNVEAFCNRIAERAVSIREQLTAPDKALQFDKAGLAQLSGWHSRAGSGNPKLDEQQQNGKTVLHVGTTGSAVGMWFTKVRLEPGHYRFEGKIRTAGLAVDPGDRRGGAGLRVSPRRMNQKLTGDTGWTPVVFEFDVQDSSSEFGFMAPITDDVPEVELICELRGSKGEAWFDRDSLHLTRK